MKKNYMIGPNFIRLGALVIHNNTLQPIARSYLEVLSEETEEDVYLGILADHTHLLYIDKVEGKESVRLNVAVGSRRSLHHTSIGKLLLATFNQKELEKYLSDNPLRRTAKNTITNKKRLFQELEKIREHEMSITDEESIDGIFSIAAPIKNVQGEIIAGVGISVPVRRATPRLEYLKSRVKNTARLISKDLGYR